MKYREEVISQNSKKVHYKVFEVEEFVIKSFSDYSLIVSKVKYKVIHGKGRPSDLVSRLKILTPKQML